MSNSQFIDSNFSRIIITEGRNYFIGTTMIIVITADIIITITITNFTVIIVMIIVVVVDIKAVIVLIIIMINATIKIVIMLIVIIRAIITGTHNYSMDCTLFRQIQFMMELVIIV